MQSKLELIENIEKVRKELPTRHWLLTKSLAISLLEKVPAEDDEFKKQLKTTLDNHRPGDHDAPFLFRVELEHVLVTKLKKLLSP